METYIYNVPWVVVEVESALEEVEICNGKVGNKPVVVGISWEVEERGKSTDLRRFPMANIERLTPLEGWQ